MPSIASPVVILGARSDIGRALGRHYAERGCAVVLAARGADTLADDATDLRLRYGVAATTAELDVTDGGPDAFFDRLGEAPGTVIAVAGLLGDQDEAFASDEAAARILETNFSGVGRYLLAAARRVPAPGGAIIGISSVAGDRGRGSNGVYGAAKAGLTALLSALRNRLAAQGVQVITVKPGFVATRMTADMDLPKALTAQPDAVAKAVVRAQAKGRDVVYAKPLWRWIMLVIRTIPEPVFKRLKL